MNVLVISGSRNLHGQTARAANALIKGIEDAGGQCEMLMLPTMSVERCRQCDDSGWGTCIGEGTCVIGDDFDEVAAKISKADAVVFANPVYFSDLSESMRAFLDRLRRISWNRPGQAGTGGKPALGICVAGGSGNGAPECCWRLEQFLTRCGFDVVDMVPVKRQNLDMKTQTLEIAGRWLVSSGT